LVGSAFSLIQLKVKPLPSRLTRRYTDTRYILCFSLVLLYCTKRYHRTLQSWKPHNWTHGMTNGLGKSLLSVGQRVA
ncbi:hypothetical protein WG66_010596, partial [Moniliophthora roreri]